MTKFNPTLRIFEARIVLTIRKYYNLTRAEALRKLRTVTRGDGVQTTHCFFEILRASDREVAVHKLFKV